MRSFQPVAALARGLEVLRAVNREERATVGSLHARTGIDKATIVRMLETLEEEGYLLRDPEARSYVATGKVNQLSAGYRQHIEVGRRAAPVLARLRERVAWPANLAIFDGDAMVMAEVVRPDHGMVVVRGPGYRFPLLATSPGLAYFAHLPACERTEIVERLARRSDRWNQPARDPDRLEALAARIRAQGHAVTDPDYAKALFDGTMWGVSVPILGSAGPHGAIGLMILSQALPPERGVPEVTPTLKAIALELVEALEP